MCVALLCVLGIDRTFGDTSCGDVRRTFIAEQLGPVKMVPRTPKHSKYEFLHLVDQRSVLLKKTFCFKK